MKISKSHQPKGKLCSHYLSKPCQVFMNVLLYAVCTDGFQVDCSRFVDWTVDCSCFVEWSTPELLLTCDFFQVQVIVHISWNGQHLNSHGQVKTTFRCKSHIVCVDSNLCKCVNIQNVNVYTCKFCWCVARREMAPPMWWRTSNNSRNRHVTWSINRLPGEWHNYGWTKVRWALPADI